MPSVLVITEKAWIAQPFVKHAWPEYIITWNDGNTKWISSRFPKNTLPKGKLFFCFVFALLLFCFWFVLIHFVKHAWPEYMITWNDENTKWICSKFPKNTLPKGKPRTTRAELLQLKLTPIICLLNFIIKKVGNRKN